MTIFGTRIRAVDLPVESVLESSWDGAATFNIFKISG
jgi:hypothetical protein